MAKPNLPSFPKIAEIVDRVETAQTEYGPKEMDQLLYDQLQVPLKEKPGLALEDTKGYSYATGFNSSLTRGGRPWHKDPPSLGPNPSDYASMDPTTMTKGERKQVKAEKNLLKLKRLAPRRAARAIVAARAYSGSSPLSESDHPLVDHAPTPALTPEAVLLRFIGHRVTSLMEKAMTLRTEHRTALSQGDYRAARRYERRMIRKEKVARGIGEYLVDQWRSKL